MLFSADPRWTPLEADLGAGGSLSVYYSDPLGAVPARAVTKPGDNKADPNLETATYGLFSTCGRGLRAAFVENRREALFFTTRWRGRRVLAGYYRIGWYAPVVSPTSRDWALAARALRFDAAPLSLAEVDVLLGTALDVRFRSSLRLSPDETGRLFDLLDGRPDGTPRYLDEIDRLERFNAFHGGHRYIGRTQDVPFDETLADPLVAGAPVTGAGGVTNASPSGWWMCEACRHTHANKARLRQCPACGLPTTLSPLAEPPTELTLA